MTLDLPVPVLSVAKDAVEELEGMEALRSLWALFANCKESIKDGRRLENLSWRLWHCNLGSNEKELRKGPWTHDCFLKEKPTLQGKRMRLTLGFLRITDSAMNMKGNTSTTLTSTSRARNSLSASPLDIHPHQGSSLSASSNSPRSSQNTDLTSRMKIPFEGWMIFDLLRRTSQAPIVASAVVSSSPTVLPARLPTPPGKKGAARIEDDEKSKADSWDKIFVRSPLDIGPDKGAKGNAHIPDSLMTRSNYQQMQKLERPIRHLAQQPAKLQERQQNGQPQQPARGIVLANDDSDDDWTTETDVDMESTDEESAVENVHVEGTNSNQIIDDNDYCLSKVPSADDSRRVKVITPDRSRRGTSPHQQQNGVLAPDPRMSTMNWEAPQQCPQHQRAGTESAVVNGHSKDHRAKVNVRRTSADRIGTSGRIGSRFRFAPGIKPSKSDAAVPAASQVYVGYVASVTISALSVSSLAPSPIRNGLTVRSNAEYSTRRKSADQELEESSSDEEEGTNRGSPQMSESIAQQRLQAFAQRTGIESTEGTAVESNMDDSIPATQAPASPQLRNQAGPSREQSNDIPPQLLVNISPHPPAPIPGDVANASGEMLETIRMNDDNKPETGIVGEESVRTTLNEPSKISPCTSGVIQRAQKLRMNTREAPRKAIRSNSQQSKTIFKRVQHLAQPFMKLQKQQRMTRRRKLPRGFVLAAADASDDSDDSWGADEESTDSEPEIDTESTVKDVHFGRGTNGQQVIDDEDDNESDWSSGDEADQIAALEDQRFQKGMFTKEPIRRFAGIAQSKGISLTDQTMPTNPSIGRSITSKSKHPPSQLWEGSCFWTFDERRGSSPATSPSTYHTEFQQFGGFPYVVNPVSLSRNPLRVDEASRHSGRSNLEDRT